MKLSLILVLMLCVAWATSESNGRRRSQRRRPPAEVPKDLEDEEPELKSQPEEISVEEPVKNEKSESKSTEATQPPADDREKKNTSSSPLSQLFAPRGTRRPRPAPRDSGRPRPTLPSFIKNPNRVARPTPTVVAASSRNTQKKVAPTSSTARNGKVTIATNGNSARRRPTPAASVSTEDGNKRFGRNGRQKGSRSRTTSS